MTTPESYRPDESGSSPAPPELPERKPRRFQFNLKLLLAFMFASALVAFGLRQLLLYLGSLPQSELLTLPNVVMGALVLGGLFYFFFRAPFLAVKAGDIRRRWVQIQKHRRELESWGEERKNVRDEKVKAPAKPPASE